MAFNANTITTTQVDDSIVLAFADLVYFAAQPEMIVDQFANIRENINGKSIQFSKYADLTEATSALTEANEDTAENMTDSAVTLTPAEYGKSTIRTRLASLQTGGKVDIAAARAIGFNLGRTVDKLGMTALEGGSPIATVYGGTATAANNLATSDNLDRIMVNKMYNKLARRNTPPAVGGLYAAVAHDDCLHDLRADLQDIAKYGLPESVSRNAIGVMGGFVWYRTSHSTITTDASGSIDAYKVVGFGDNVLAKATSQEPGLVITGPFDRLGRFVNIGWYGVFSYGILDGNNMVFGVCSSSVGSN